MLARDVMTTTVTTVTPDTPVPEIATLLLDRHISAVPVVDAADRVLGIVSGGDLLRGLAAGGAAAPAPVTADDRAIRERLLGELDERGLVPTRHVNVVVTDGVVHLWGLIDGPEQARAIRVAAENIPGVRAVEDHLGRRPPYAGGE